MESIYLALGLLIAGLLTYSPTWAHTPESARRWIQVAASDVGDRNEIVNSGMGIEAVRSDSVWGFANEDEIKKIQSKGFKVLGNFPLEVGRGGHENAFDFPAEYTGYHNYDRLLKDLTDIQNQNSDIFRIVSIGKSLEGRDLIAIHINSNPAELSGRALSKKPGVIFMGAHHAREHLSVEVPFKLAQYLMNSRRSPIISPLLDSRDIWIIPMVNPDGAEFDVSTGEFQYWRKNRRNNGNGTYGVDLNRNYGYHWGTGGSSNNPNSDIYMGPQAFSEPETQAIRDFVRAQKNTKVLLTFHTYSELILYPWGYTNKPVVNPKDLAVFKTMATTMAKWNHYKPEASHELYTTSGDTVDWAYGELGIFAFTFEMSPGSSAGPEGFYPVPMFIDRVFNDNVKPCVYLLQVAGDPYAVVNGTPSHRFLTNYGEEQFTADLHTAF